MKTELIKILTQYDRKGFEQSELLIKVEAEIDTAEKSASFTQLLSIQAFDFKTRIYTDITDILFNHFHDQTEAMIESINWWEVWRENNKKAA